ncbi:MAG: hypothetical protein II306_01960 [Clostridia bacterium]|nr:hypothetical protein [Clostridia bacterium]
MDSEYVDKLRAEKETDSETQAEIEALLNFMNGVPQYMDGITGEIEKPSIKTNWLEKKMR